MTQPTHPNPADNGDAIDPKPIDIDAEDVAAVLPNADDEDFVAPGEADAPAPG